jgi:peptidoglycan/xylan/chitin deacetylase (PgdA/CDA1 family)
MAFAALAGILLLSAWGLKQARRAPSHPGVPTTSNAVTRLPRMQPPQLLPVKAEAITHGLRTQKKIALTFDACSTRSPSDYDERVTQVLVETKTAATIFLGGKWIEEEEAHARYLASLPQFELGNHTYLHPHMTQIPDNQIRDELRQTQEILFKVTGRLATLFRPPYGEYDDRVVKIAAEMGLTTIEYDLASGDPDIHITKDKLVEYVTSTARNGSIVVMHINRRGWHTAEALPEIISILRKRGFQLVTVGELLHDMKGLK